MDPMLGISLTALHAAQKALAVAGHNIANVNTPGFSRQRLDLAPLPPTRAFKLEPGNGVEILNVFAIRDQLLENMLVDQDPLVGAATRRTAVLGEIETLFSTDPEASLGVLISNFFSSFRELARNPDGAAERQAVVHHAATLCVNVNTIAESLRAVNQRLLPHVDEAVDKVNELSERIADLNGLIRDTVVKGGEANDLIDRRQNLIRELADLLPVSVIPNTLGRVDVRHGGMLLVSTDDAMAIEAVTTTDGVQLQTAGRGSVAIEPTSGRLGALLELSRDTIPSYAAHLDAFAAALIREVNHTHSTGVGRDGSFTVLNATQSIARPDQPLNANDLPFALEAGHLRVVVTDTATGLSAAERIDFDPDVDSLADIAARLGAIDHLGASVSGDCLHILAGNGYTFDFTNRLPTEPVALGTASFTLSGTYGRDVDGQYTLTANDTGTIGADSEVVPDPANVYDGAATLGGAYTGDDNRDYLVEIVNGGDLSTATYRVSEDGGATWGSTLALAAGTLDVYDDLNGVDLGVDLTFTNATFGAGDRFAVTAVAGLTLDVTDAYGATIAVLDVGPDYEPGTPLQLPGGPLITFAAGDLDATVPDSATLDFYADTDPSGLLAALGLNTFFSGSDAATIAVEDEVQADPDRIAAGRTGAAADGSNAVRIAAIQTAPLDALDGYTLDDHAAQLLGQVGLDSQMAVRAAERATLMAEAMANQRDAVSGVSQDEEVVNLIRFQQAYGLAARYLATVQQVTDLLVNL